MPTILLIGDHVELLSDLTDALSARGYVVQRAAIVTKLERLLAQSLPHMVILVNPLIGLTLPESCMIVRRTAPLERTVLLVCCDARYSDTVEACRDEGVNGFIETPRVIPDFLAVVEGFLSRGSPER